jgi:hypothetical protein
MSQSKHDYRPVRTDPAEFRLVKIHAGVRPNHIIASLATYPLNDHPPYEALSYVWGAFNLEDPELIELDERSFMVTTNLLGVLYHLRRENEERIFWIDAICIDQENLEERSSQVQLMRDIYKGASQTVVWLGEDSLPSLRFFDFLKSVDSRRAWEDEDERKVVLQNQIRLQNQLATDKDVQNIVRRGLYGDIAQRDFWTRIWIVQEVAISFKVTIYCGSDRMSWDEFSNSICK